jgi:hypothetical protein
VPRSANARQQMTSVAVSLPYSGVNVSVTPGVTITLYQEPNSHDVANINLPIQRFNGIRNKLGYGTPITFTWTCPSGSQTFVGHIHHVVPYVTETVNGTTIVAVSAGFPLKRRQQKIWTQVTAPDVARSLAIEHNMAFDVEAHPRLFPQIAQSDQSDWALLRGLAERIGYSLRVEGVTLQFVSKATLERYYRPMAMKITVLSTDNALEIGLRDAITFTPQIGEQQPENPDSLARRRLAALDTSGHLIAAVSNSMKTPGRQPQTPLYDMYMNEVARSMQESVQIVADASERARYPTKATARLYGDPHIAPNRSILLEQADNDLAGFWTVLCCTHNIVPGSGYTMDVILGTEGLGAETIAPTQTGTLQPATGLLNTPYPNAVLVQDTSADAKARWIPVKS